MQLLYTSRSIINCFKKTQKKTAHLQLLVAEGDNAPVDLLAETKLARRETADNSAALETNADCDAGLTTAVQQVADLTS